MIYDYLVIGHLTADLQEDGSTIELAAPPCSPHLPHYHLGARVAILSTASPDLDLSMIPPQIDVTLLPSPVSTAFRNIYQQRRTHPIHVSPRASIHARRSEARATGASGASGSHRE